MPSSTAARNAEGDWPAGSYQRHRPEQTLLYQIVEQHYPAFTAHLAERGKARSCQAMCKANSRITSNADGWNMAFCGCAASRVTSSTWLPSVVVRSGRLSAVPAQDAMKVDVNENLG